MEKTTFHRFYSLRGILMAPVFAFMLFSTYGECEKHWIFSVAWAIFGAGFAIRVWAQMHLHYRLRVHKVLTTTGPYRFVRNPIYIANTLILAAACVMSELVWLTPLVLAWCALVYSFVVRHEENHLSEKYGTPYIHYLQEVPRWLPRVPAALNTPAPIVRNFLLRSVRAELFCFLYVLPFVLKEILSDLHVPLLFH